MDLTLTAEQDLIVSMVRRFVREEIVPLELGLDPDADELPAADRTRLVAKVKEMGLYGLDIPPGESITQSQLDTPNPYNTRLNRGLPPTPIGNPGLASMKAAAKPAATDFVYYARKQDCKTHFFTASEAEFLAFLDGPRC